MFCKRSARYLLAAVALGCVQLVDSGGTDPVVDLLLDLAGFGNTGTGSHAGTCPPITINPSSRLFYVENIENDFTPGKPRHLRSLFQKRSKLYDERHLATKQATNMRATSGKFRSLPRHLVTKRSTKVRPVTVDKYLGAYVYDSPTDGPAGHRCGTFCDNDESCGLRRKCCRTPCGFACYNAVYNLTAHLKT